MSDNKKSSLEHLKFKFFRLEKENEIDDGTGEDDETGEDDKTGVVTELETQFFPYHSIRLEPWPYGPNAKLLVSWIHNYMKDKHPREEYLEGKKAEPTFNEAASNFDTAFKKILRNFTEDAKAITVPGDATHCGFKILKACEKGDSDDYTTCIKLRKLIFTPNSNGDWIKENKGLDIAITFPKYEPEEEEMEGGRKRRRRRRKSKRKTKRKTKKRTSKRKTKRKRKTKKRRRRKR